MGTSVWARSPGSARRSERGEQADRRRIVAQVLAVADEGQVVDHRAFEIDRAFETRRLDSDARSFAKHDLALAQLQFIEMLLRERLHLAAGAVVGAPEREQGFDLLDGEAQRAGLADEFG